MSAKSSSLKCFTQNQGYSSVRVVVEDRGRVSCRHNRGWVQLVQFFFSFCCSVSALGHYCRFLLGHQSWVGATLWGRWFKLSKYFTISSHKNNLITDKITTSLIIIAMFSNAHVSPFRDTPASFQFNSLTKLSFLSFWRWRGRGSCHFRWCFSNSQRNLDEVWQWKACRCSLSTRTCSVWYNSSVMVSCL